MRSVLSSILILSVVPIVGLCGELDAVKAMADVETASIASFPVGSWMKFRDANGVDRLVTVTQKTQGKDGWLATTTVVLAKAGATSAKPASVQQVYGSIPNLTKQGITAVRDESISIGGASISCKVFTFTNGQKKWMSAAVPAGGTVKVVGPKGEAFVTLIEHGKP